MTAYQDLNWDLLKILLDMKNDAELSAIVEELRRRADEEATRRASEIVRDTYGPLLAPIRQLITGLALSPGEVIVSVAIREATGEIRIVHLDEAR